uniref:NADP-dependent oxidoreductase domain-containing protein n=1 Tax=Polyblepharides amylifera TaxID=1486889 RepID=A0A7R9SV01_9CHLO|mmetsp:Transcript_1165/g.1637  ORF Transcript_1165/g.1637 Transcript_1165/m.1637 type:complete len:373 (+) Transcript_1165:104-1222(+)|eukprot:CAMPEP_0196583504 /NCGR_PEP_ID=MMETSP1081-20130531/43869_1 /TAXON_ID=36882 /ORGANISM="Pyramimonas amylifera, Strain CCMP720" /LENGTH=372 /DNA_ID=CAMNT_0041904421 /DNA_START=94 /DNA_END=1212 /DNA_ORIENTATION=-
MKYNKLGSSDMMVSEVCLGTMTWGAQNTEEEAHAQLDAFIAAGGNFIDTAELYPVPPGPEWVGKTEEFIGNWLEKRTDREKMFIASKASGPRPADWIVAKRDPSAPACPPALSPAQIRQAVDAILRRLKTPYLDLIQLHWPQRYAPLFGVNQYHVSMKDGHMFIPEEEWATREQASFEDQVRVCGELIKEGKVRHWGLSNETTFGVCQLCETAKRIGVPLPISIQNDLSLVDRRFESELAEACAPQNYNIGLIPYGCLAGGTLSGKYANGATPEGARHTRWPDFQARYICPLVQEAAKEYAVIAEKYGITQAQLALGWARSRWYCTSTIIGATSLKQLEENLSVYEMDMLSEPCLAEIDQVHLKFRNPNVQD